MLYVGHPPDGEAARSDGDVVFQLRKTQRSGLWGAVDGRVLIYLHEEQMLKEVESRYPARHYVMVDDKLPILAAMKKIWRTARRPCSRGGDTTHSIQKTSPSIRRPI